MPWHFGDCACLFSGIVPKQKGRLRAACCSAGPEWCREDDFGLFLAFNRPGSDLLSRVLRRSTIGAGAFHGRVRNGNGCSHPAITTRSTKGKNCAGDSAKPNEKLVEGGVASFIFEHVFFQAALGTCRSEAPQGQAAVASRDAARPERVSRVRTEERLH